MKITLNRALAFVMLVPEPLSQTMVEVHEKESYVVFSSAMFSGDGKPSLQMAFATSGPPPDPEDKPGWGWVRVRDTWYQLAAGALKR